MDSASTIQVMESFAEVIQDNFGEHTAHMYRIANKDKNIRTIILSASDLLEKFVGEQKKNEIVGTILEKNNVPLRV